jgi:hypothetical protein
LLWIRSASPSLFLFLCAPKAVALRSTILFGGKLFLKLNFEIQILYWFLRVIYLKIWMRRRSRSRAKRLFQFQFNSLFIKHLSLQYFFTSSLNRI